MQLVHGGDWAGYRAEFGRDSLDFSANVSPLGLPEGVARAITAALPTADRYPDPLCRELRAKLALHEGVPAEQILCGNGAADLIFRLVWAQKPPPGAGHRPHLCEYALLWKVSAARWNASFCGSRRTLRSRMRSVRPSVRGWTWYSSASPTTPPAS